MKPWKLQRSKPLAVRCQLNNQDPVATATRQRTERSPFPANFPSGCRPASNSGTLGTSRKGRLTALI
ncbi:hypothetical protein CEP52_005002 [Fusarium oligoseptatum]|uniref:Uncharacterized protein n=1 Tax=Fusarium oligoseptatum TaxID=2604345 RepID=A0A428U0P9_9HYPO|nr:hypothetical protein CEP52_005002 [Fusarium oligoseptatum]